MANPQKENGYTAIANEVLEQLVKAGLLGSELSMALFVIRKTWGFQKKEDIISFSQFEKGLDISRMTISKTIKNLVSRNMLVKTPLPHNRISFKFNKDYEKWVVKTPILVKSKGVFGIHAYTKTSKDAYTHKRKKERTKESIVTKRDTPFSLKEEITKLEESTRRDLNILALYFTEKKPDLQNREQFNVALKRHIRGANSLKSFTDGQIIKAVEYAKKEYKDIWTLETINKILTK